MKVLYDKIPTEDDDSAQASGSGDGKKRANRPAGKVPAVFVETLIQNEVDVDVSRLELNMSTDTPNIPVEEKEVPAPTEWMCPGRISCYHTKFRN